MCLIIFSPEGSLFPKSEHVRAVMNNPHGVGIMWRAADGTTRRQRYFQQADKAYATIKSLARQGVAYAVHYRYATHGTTNFANVHPFKCGSGAALMHNGVINLWDRDKSDTALLAESLNAISPTWYRKENVWNLLELGVEGSRLVVCTPDGWRIVHESTGHWHDGRWYSARARGSVIGYSEPGAWAGGNGLTVGKPTAAPLTLGTGRAAVITTPLDATGKPITDASPIHPSDIRHVCVVAMRVKGHPLYDAWVAAEAALASTFTNPTSGAVYAWSDEHDSYLCRGTAPAVAPQRTAK